MDLNDLSISAEKRHSWQKRKEKTKFHIVTMFVLLNIIGFELAASGFSFTKSISSHLIHSDTLSDYISYINNSALRNIFPIYTTASFGKLLKLGIELAFILLVMYFVSVRDPFSNWGFLNRLLENMKCKKATKYLPWRNELTYYANKMPSSYMASLCNTYCPDCPDHCKFRVPQDGLQKVYAWHHLFGGLTPDMINKIQESVRDCRHAFYFKYGFMYSFAIQVAAYISVEIINKYWHVTEGIRIGHLFIIVSSLSLYIYFGWVNNLRGEDGYGVWEKFDITVKEIIYSPEFKKIYQSRTCSREAV